MQKTLVSTLAISIALSSAAIADDKDNAKVDLKKIDLVKVADDDKKKSVISKWGPAPTFKSADGRFEMKPRGRIFYDFGIMSDKDNSMDINATEFRTARLGIEGKAWSNVKYKFEADFSGDEVEVKDAYMAYKTGDVSINIGQHKTSNSLEEQTSSRYITTMERASFTDAFSLARRTGISLNTGGDDWTATIGVFKGSNSDTSDHSPTEFAGRVTYGPMTGDTQLHFGASFRMRDAGDGNSGYRYRQRPHNHLSDRFVNTDRLGGEDSMFAAEFAAINGAFSFQSEYAQLKNDYDMPGMDSPTFRGGYAEISYFLSGGKRSYDPKKGTFGRNKVDTPAGDGGKGAWQMTARYDVLDLNDEGITGGTQKTAIVGVNWYLNKYMRVMANYSNAKVKNAWNVAANGADGKNTINAFGLRAQIDW